MAFDYTSDTATTTGEFVRMGKIISRVNSYATLAATTYPADLALLNDSFSKAEATNLITNIYGYYKSLQDGIVSQRQSVASYLDNILTDPIGVLTPLNLNTADIPTILRTLLDQMVIDGKTIQKNTVTVGSVTPYGSNNGNGTVLVTKVLDGYNAAVLGGIPYLNLKGLNSEQACTSEIMRIQCTSDSFAQKVLLGTEQFSWNGGAQSRPFDYNAEGSGPGPGLRVANGSYSYVTDGSFENWTSSTVPTNWTVDAGSSCISQQTPAGANVYLGASSMKYAGDGATATIQVSQAIAPSRLIANKMYCVSVYIKASGVPAAGTIAVNFTGTGYTAAASEKISIAHGSFPTGWTLYNFFIVMPAVIPSDWKLVIAITGTLSNGTNVYFDALALADVVYHGGVGAVVIQGSSPFVLGDYFTFTTANDNAGNFQSFLKRKYKFQLPSSGTPNISDSLAA